VEFVGFVTRNNQLNFGVIWILECFICTAKYMKHANFMCNDEFVSFIFFD